MGMQLKTWMKRNRIAIRRILSLALAIAMVPGLLVLTDNILSVGASGGGNGDEVSVEDNPRDLPGDGEDGQLFTAALDEGFETFGGTVNTTIETKDDFVATLGVSSVYLEKTEYTVETGNTLNVPLMFKVSSTNNADVAGDALYIRIELPDTTSSSTLREYGDNDKFHYYFGDQYGPTGKTPIPATNEAGKECVYMWVKVHQKIKAGSIEKINLPEFTPFYNGYTANGIISEGLVTVFFKDVPEGDETTLIEPVGDIDQTLKIISDAHIFNWYKPEQGLTQGPDGVSISSSTSNPIKLTGDAAPGDVTFTYKTGPSYNKGARQNGYPYAYIYAKKLVFTEYYSVPKAFLYGVDNSALKAAVSVTAPSSDFTFTSDVAVVGAIGDTAIVKVTATAVPNAGEAYAELKILDDNISVTFYLAQLYRYGTSPNYTYPSYAAFLSSPEPSATYKLETVDKPDRGIVVYPVAQPVGVDSTHNKLDNGGTGNFQTLPLVYKAVYYKMTKPEAVKPEVSTTTLTKSVRMANTSDTYSSSILVKTDDTVEFKLSGFGNPTDPTKATLDQGGYTKFSLIDKVGNANTSGASTDISYGYSLGQMIPVELKTGSYIGVTGAYRIVVTYDTNQTAIINADFGTNDTVPLNDPSNITKIEYQYYYNVSNDAERLIPPGFEPNADPTISYEILAPTDTTAITETYYNSAYLNYSYNNYTNATEFTLTEHNPMGTSTVNVKTNAPITAGTKLAWRFDPVTGTADKTKPVNKDNFLQPGDFVYYEIEVKNTYDFPVYNPYIIDTYSVPYLTPNYTVTVGGITKTFADYITVISPSPTSEMSVKSYDLTYGADQFSISLEGTLASDLTSNTKSVLKVGYVLQVTNDQSYLYKELHNKFEAFAFTNSGEYGPGPGEGPNKVPLGEGKWEGFISHKDSRPSVKVTKELLNQNVLKLDETLRFKMTIQLDAASDPVKPVTVVSMTDTPDKHITFSENNLKAAYFVATINGAVTPYYNVYQGDKADDGISPRFVLPDPIELRDTGDKIELYLNGNFASNIFDENPPQVEAKNTIRVFTKEEPSEIWDTGSFKTLNYMPGTSIIKDGCYDVTVGAGYTKDASENLPYDAAGNHYIKNHVTITINRPVTELTGYITKKVKNGKSLTLDTAGNLVRTYEITVNNTSTDPITLSGLVDLLPPYEELVSIHMGSTQLYAKTTIESYPVTDSTGYTYQQNRYSVVNFTGSGDPNAFLPVQVPVAAYGQTVGTLTFTVVSKIANENIGYAIADLQRLDVNKAIYNNNAYAFFYETVAPSNGGRAAVNSEKMLIGDPLYNVSGTGTSKVVDEKTSRHQASAEVDNTYNQIIPTVYIEAQVYRNNTWQKYNASINTYDITQVRWCVYFSNVSKTNDIDKPTFMITLPKGMTLSRNGGVARVTEADGSTLLTEGTGFKVTKDTDGREVILVTYQGTLQKNDASGKMFYIYSDQPTGEYADYTASARNIPKSTQPFYFSEVLAVNHTNVRNNYSSPMHEDNFNGKLNGALLGNDYLQSDQSAKYVIHWATVSIYGELGCISEKTVTGEGPDGSPHTAEGNNNSTQNYITLKDQTTRFDYVLNVENTSDKTIYNNIVFIDRLPAIGDKGVVRQDQSRNSLLNARLASMDKGDYKVSIWKYNTSTKDYDLIKSLTDGEFTLHFATVEPDDSFNTNGDWGYSNGITTGVNSTRWKETGLTTATANAFRIELLNKTLDPGQKVTVEYSAYLNMNKDDDAGKIAYNTFGYQFSAATGGGTKKSYTPEPAKVGVRAFTYIPGDKLSIEKKVVDKDQNSVAIPPSTTFLFDVIAKNKATGEEIYLYGGNEPLSVQYGEVKEISTPYDNEAYEYKIVEHTNLDYYEEAVIYDLKITKDRGNRPGSDHYSFTVTNTLKSKSVSITKEVRNAASTAFSKPDENIFSFHLFACTDKDLQNRVPDEPYLNNPIELKVVWKDGKWISDTTTITGLPVQYYYGFEELQHSSGANFNPVGLTTNMSQDDLAATFYVVNNAPDIYFSLEKVLIEDGLDNVVETKFRFDVTPTGKSSFPVDIEVTKVDGTNTYTNTYNHPTPYPYGTEFDVKEDTSKLNKTYKETVSGELKLVDDRWVYAFTYENKAPGTEYVKARIDKSVVGNKDAFDRTFYFKVTPSRFGTDLEPEYLTVTVGDNRTGSVETKLAYIKGTTFTVEEIRMDELTYDYEEPAISEGILSEDGFLYVFTAVNTLEDGEVYARIRKTIEDTDTNVNGTFTFSVTPVDKDGQPLPTTIVTIRMNGGRVAVSGPIGPYPYGTRFPTSGIVETSTGSVRYYSPLISIASDGLDANGNAWFTINANNQRIPPETPETPNNPNPTPPDVTPGTPTTPSTPSPSGPNRNNNPDYTPIGDQPIPLANLPGLTTIMDDEVPLANLPFTGGGKAVKRVGFFGFLALMAGAIAGAFGKKKEDEDEPA